MKWRKQKENWVGVKHRAAGSPSVYFGPFGSMKELERFANANRITLGIVRLVDQNSDPEKFWD